MAGLDMSDAVTGVFVTHAAIRTSAGGSYVDGRWMDGVSTVTTHDVNLQPVSPRERQVLVEGGVRLVDARVVRFSDGLTPEILPADTWVFPGIPGEFRSVAIDSRPWHNYCRVVVSRIDT